MNDFAQHEPIAIIGMACRFPGASDLGQFWTDLHAGVQSIRFLSDDELLAEGVTPQALVDPHYVKASSTAPEVDGFDAEFFGLTPAQARILDPQARLLLECGHAALEDTGYDVEQLANVGVFASAGTWQRRDQLRRGNDVRLRSSAAPALLPTNYLAALVSGLLGLRGPSQAVDAGSLVAIHLACTSLSAGDCGMALAGGAALVLPLGLGYRWEPGGELSPDGQCRPFDKAASGTVPASGAGMVVLKRLAEAQADRDHIWAVIRSSAINYAGARNVASGAASVAGQSAAIATAMSSAGVHPSDLSLVEANAAGEPSTDGNEVTALMAAFDRLGATELGHCALTSVKGNVGHLGNAAGAAALIKVALSLTHEIIPPHVNFAEPHPSLGLDDSPFYVPTRAVRWARQEGRARYAGVNDVGAGGVNAHVILAEAPSVAPLRVEGRPHELPTSWSTSRPAVRGDHRAHPFGAAAGGHRLAEPGAGQAVPGRGGRRPAT